MSLTNEDVERLDSIMNAVIQRREDRGLNIPDRDEEKISEILRKADRTAMVEHEQWLYSVEQFGSTVRFQPPVSEDDSKRFPQLDRYRNFTGEE